MPWFKKNATPAVDDNMAVPVLLHEARISVDPRYTHALLLRAQHMEPDNPAVQRALLMLGNLHRRATGVGDYSIIKCYLLHAFEHPEQHSQEEQQRMAREIFDHPLLLSCLRLSPQPDVFLKEYLYDLCLEYVRIFIAGDNSHAPRVFGFSSKNLLHKYLSAPAADVVRNIFLTPFLTEEEQTLLGKGFYEAFARQMDGNTADLDRKLGAQLCARLA